MLCHWLIQTYHGNSEAHFRANSPVETSGWGNAPGAWGIADAPAATDTWGMSKNEPGDAWDEHAGSLLQPPGPAHGILPTIPEQASENYNQFRRSLSDIGESRESQDYSTSFSASQDSPDTRYAEVQGQQSQTVTATAAPSAMGSPAPPPTISITEAFSKVNAAGLVGQKMTSASEAARRQEEQRSRLHAQPAKTTTISPAVHYEPLKDHLSHMAGGHTPMSSASAAAALFESTSNKLRAQNNKPPQPSVPAAPGKTTWTYPKPLTPGARLPAAIPPDPSWTMTGGNAWSNKHRQTKSATVHWPQGSENAWSHHPPQHSQQHAQNGHPQGLAVGPSPAQNRPQHQKNNSHPHPTHTAFQQASSAQHTHWQGWGKEKWPQEESESDSEDETMDGEWDNGEGWSQQNGGGWNQQNGGGWNQQNGGGWNQHSGGRGQQKQHHGHNRKGDPTQTGQGRGGKQPEDPRAQDTAWGRQNGNWDQGGTAWGQHNDDWSQGQGRGQVQGQGQGRGQGQGIGQPRSDNAWHQQEDIGWGQDSGWGKAEGDPGAWGKPNSEAGWGRENSEWQPGRTSPIEWATGQPKKGAHGDSDPAKNQMSEHHRNQIMNAMVPQTLKNSNMTTAQLQAAHLRTAQQQAHLAARGQISPDPKAKEGNVWEAYDADNGWGSMDSGDEEYDANRRVHFEPKASGLWGGSPHSVPSKTLAYAQQQQGMATTPINLASAVRFVESKGAAFSFVNHAFFGNVRLARERIHWMFPPNKDERVANMLAWVQKMSFNLATFGVRIKSPSCLPVKLIVPLVNQVFANSRTWCTFLKCCLQNASFPQRTRLRLAHIRSVAKHDGQNVTGIGCVL